MLCFLFSKVFYCYKILNSNKLNYHISYDYDKKTKYIIKITTRKMESIFYMLKLDIDGIINPYDIFIKNGMAPPSTKIIEKAVRNIEKLATIVYNSTNIKQKQTNIDKIYVSEKNIKFKK